MKCSYCGRERDLKKINSTNWNRHVNSCKIKFKGGNKSLDTLNFFIKTTNKLSTSGKYLIYIYFLYNIQILIFQFCG